MCVHVGVNKLLCVFKEALVVGSGGGGGETLTRWKITGAESNSGHCFLLAHRGSALSHLHSSFYIEMKLDGGGGGVGGAAEM